MAKPEHSAPFPFTSLPKEIRDAIWDLAVLAENRGLWRVHHISVAGTRSDLAAPRDDRVDDPSQFARNNGSNHLSSDHSKNGKNREHALPVASLKDENGLWDACPESREAVIRRWKQTKGRPKQLCMGHPARWMNVTGFADLLIIDEPNVESSFDIMRNIFEDPLWRFDHPEHIGVVYNKAWVRELESLKESLRGKKYINTSVNHDLPTSFHWLARQIQSLASRRPCDATLYLWLIDYSLEPVAGMDFSSLLQKRQVFRANGRIYVQVKKYQDAGYWRTSALKSAAEFEELLTGLFYTYHACPHAQAGMDRDDKYFLTSDLAKVAACLPDSFLKEEGVKLPPWKQWLLE